MKVLVCPLDWGLGHATRSIPLIRALLHNGHEVMIGATGGGLRLLKTEFPNLDAFDFPGYQVRYSRSPAMFLPIMLLQMPFLVLALFRERSRLTHILDEKSPDLIISDGRYGVCTHRVPSVFVTHQVFIRVPGRFPGKAIAERMILALNLRLLRKFRQVWVPDYPGPKNLSGDLSHKSCDLPNLVFIHPLSRFGAGDVIPKIKAMEEIHVLAMVSGPEPQRGLFESVLRKELERMPGTHVLVRGLPGPAAPENQTEPVFRAGVLNEFNHLSGETMALLLSQAKMVVARSGYTTVMEMAGLGVRAAVLVPTPGQSEQDYLADHLDGSGTAMRMDQSKLNLADAMQRIPRYSGFAVWSHGMLKLTEGVSQTFILNDFIRNHPLFGSVELREYSSTVEKTRQEL